MIERTILLTLIDMAQTAMQEAGHALHQITREHSQAQQQLAQLLGYRQDYQFRLQQVGQAGTSLSNYRNLIHFLALLDDAVVQQNGLLARLDSRVKSGRREWHVRRCRLKALETLASRERLRALAQHNKAEQCVSDEAASHPLFSFQ